MTIQHRGQRIESFKTPEAANEAIFNLSRSLIDAKQKGEIEGTTYDELKVSIIDPFIRLAGEMMSAKGSVEQNQKEAEKYGKLRAALEGHVAGGHSLENMRVSLSLLIGELMISHPKDMNLRALHTNLMSEKPGTHQPTFKVAELHDLISYAIGKGARDLCIQYQQHYQQKANAATEDIPRMLIRFNQHFAAMKTEVASALNANKAKHDAALKGKANLVLDEQIQEITNHFKNLFAADGDDIKLVIQYSHMNQENQLLLNQQLDRFGAALQNNNMNEILASAKAVVSICRNGRTIGDYLRFGGLRSAFEYYHHVFEQKKKMENNEIKPGDILQENIQQKSENVKRDTETSNKFFTQYAVENKDAKFSSYTANKGKLAEACSQLMKKIQDNISMSKYGDGHDVEQDIQKIDALREEYRKVLEQGRNSALLFAPKGTGKFATHMNTQMLALKKELQELQVAFQHAGKLKK